MSGTSLDGIDVAVVEISGRRIETLAFRSAPYPRKVREAILAISGGGSGARFSVPARPQVRSGASDRAILPPSAQIARIHFLLGELYAEAVLKTCRRAKLAIDLIGCHGQTIYHEGDAVDVLGRRIACTLQIGEASIIAARTGVPVVSDFRPADMAAGGKGAPLVPFVDYRLFRHRTRRRVALNIGGIANITCIPASARPEDVVAFDTGPGNMVIDALVAEATGGRQAYDRGGRIASGGRVNRALLDDLLKDPYYRRRPPKTAGREQYGAEFIARLKRSRLSWPDLIATATALTAATIAAAIRLVGKTPDDLIVSGGGSHNPRILAHLAALLPGAGIATSDDYGINADAKEAIAFAVLAHETWRGRPSNLPSATGARRPAVLGKITRA